MAAYLNEEERERERVLEMLREQLGVEERLIELYEQTINEIDYKPIQYMFRMIQIDSKKHAEMLQVALEILQGQEILIKDRRSLKVNLKEHLELERESIYKGNELLNYKWLTEREGLRLLIKNWRDDELKHHKFLKELSEKSYIPISSDDFVAVLREEEYLEKRYLLLKRFI